MIFIVKFITINLTTLHNHNFLELITNLDHYRNIIQKIEMRQKVKQCSRIKN